MGGSSKKQTVGYKYYLGMHMVLCHGPADSLLRIAVDERRAWSGKSTGGRINISADGLFGGEKREGGISGSVDLEMGGPAQAANDYLLQHLGSNVPAFRGVTAVILRHCYLGMNPYLKKWAFRLSRIHKRQAGIAQWYDQKSEIGQVDRYIVPAVATGWQYVILPHVEPPGYSNLTPPSTGWQSGTSPFGQSWTWPGQPSPQSVWPAGTMIWAKKTITVPPSATVVARVRAENGAVLFLNGSFWGAANRDNPQIPLGEAFDFELPSGTHELTVKGFDENPTLGDTYLSVEILALGHKDMNPAHIIRECLTDPDWGMGYQESDIDDVSFVSAAITLYDESMGMSLLWDRQISIEGFIQEVIKHIDATLYVSRSTGKFVLKLIRNDYVVENLPVFNPGNVEKFENPTRTAFGELTNSVTVNYWDAGTGKDSSVTTQDPALVQMQGAVINTALQYPGFTNFELATRIAMRDLKSLSSALLACTIHTNQDGRSLNIGDAFILSWPDFEIDSTIMRVTGINFGDGRSNKIRITCMEDVFNTPSLAIQVQVDPEDAWVDIIGPPIPILYGVAVEAPYYEIVQTLGQTDADRLLTDSQDTGFVIGASARTGTALNAAFYTNDGSSYEDVGTLDFCPCAILSTNVDHMATTFVVSNELDMDLITLGSYAQLGSEFVRIDTYDSALHTITVGRGILDTIPQAHAEGEFLLFWDYYYAQDPTEYVHGETVKVKMLPISGQGMQPLEAAAEYPVTLNSRAFRPYPPGQFRINSTFFPADVPADAPIVLSWVHRNRIQQTGATLLDFTSGTLTPESGTTYELEFVMKDANGLFTVYLTEDLGLVTTKTVDLSISPYKPPADAVELTVKLYSKRQGMRSLQAYEFTITLLLAPYNLSAKWRP